MMLVIPVASAGSASHATPPAPSDVRTYPSEAEVETMEISLPLVVVVAEIGKVASRADTETLLDRVRNSFVSTHVRVGSTGAMSASNSS
jgi:hypothetical protein